jgi:hypothetical protein
VRVRVVAVDLMAMLIAADGPSANDLGVDAGARS